MNAHDDATRRLIGAGDPAASLPDLASEDLERLTEAAMTDEHRTTHQNASGQRDVSESERRDVAGRRSRRTAWVTASAIGAAAAATAAAVVVPNLLASDEVPQSADPGTTAVTEISQPAAPDAGQPAGMCAEVTPESIATYAVSFRAEVESIDGDTVRLTVTDRYRGQVEDTVTTTQGDGAGIDGEPIVFTPEQTYLLTTNDQDQIITCGVSGEDSPELASLYTQAAGN